VNNKICLYNVTTAIKSGGIETFYWEMAKFLKQDGYDVEIISGEGNYIKYDDLKLKMFDFKSRDNIIDLGNRFKKWGERISFFINSYKYLISQKYDYILIHKPLDFFIAYFLKRKKKNLKVIFVSGGEDFYGFDKYFAKYIDTMFAVSKNNVNIIKNRYNRDVHILHNGVDTNIFKKDIQFRKDLRKKYNLENKKVIISVGRVVSLKGYQLVIESLTKLKDQDIIYVLIGDGNYLNKLKRLVKDFDVVNSVLFLGEIENKDLNRYLSMADLFIQPTIGNEAFGITIIEAMSCNLPVVASENGGIVDIIEDGKNGYLFEIGNTTQMIEKIEIAFDNLATLSQISRKYVEDNFTWKKTISIFNKQIKG
jgi:glycosyltransferase involved in cell wall biosynthesis